MVEQMLLGRFKNISYKEESLPEEFLSHQKDVEAYWETLNFSKRDPKIRINGLEFLGERRIRVALSEGIDFANIVHTGDHYTSKGIPETPEETYQTHQQETSHTIMRTDDRFANAAAVGAIIMFGDKDPQIIFGIRSKKVFGNPGTISISVNGYVEPLRSSKNLLIDNLYKEIEEEVFIKKNEIKEISFVGPAQMRGKSCDLIWIIKATLPYPVWLDRWQETTVDKELAGIVSLKRSEIPILFSANVKKIMEHSIVPNQLRKLIEGEGVKLNPLLIALEMILMIF